MSRPLSISRLKVFLFSLFIITSFAVVNGQGCGGGGTTEGGTTTDGGPTPEGGGGTAKEIGEACSAHDECKQGLICGTEDKCAKPQCVEDTDCKDKSKQCDGGFCVGKQCKTSSECPAGQDCREIPGKGKFCENIPGGVEVASIVITTNPGVIREGVTVTFKAIALNKSGAVLRSQTKFTWASSKTDVVKMSNDKATGGSKDGTSDITASIGSVKSKPVSLRNFAKLGAGKVRMVVTNSKGEAVSGATVQFKFSGGVKDAKTDAQGVASADGAAPFDVHVFHNDYAYFSIFGTDKTDLYVQLSGGADKSKLGKAKGKFDFSKIKRLLGKNDKDWSASTVAIGLAGFSISGNLLELDLDLLLGESVKTKLLGNDIDLPGGVYIDSPFGKKTNYSGQTTPGTRVIWGLGGKFKADELLKLVPQDTKNLNVGEILAKAKPLLKDFVFGASPTIDVTAGSSKDHDMVLNTKLDQSLDVKTSNAPSAKDKKGKDVAFYNIALAGVMLPSTGIVPMGLAIDKAAAGNTLPIKYADRTGALTGGKFVVLTLALNIPLGDDAPPLMLAGHVKFFDKSPSPYTAGAFMAFPTTAKFDPASGKLTNASVAGASFHQLDISGAKGKRWIVVYGANKEITLPKPPSGFTGEWESASLRPVKLSGGQTMGSMLEFNEVNMDRLTEYIESFSNYTVYEKPKK